MKNKDTTLCIDGNFFIYSRLHIMPKPKKTAIIVDGKSISTQLMSEEKEMKAFMQKLAMDFASEVRKFQDIVNRIVFVVDSKSWRKDYNKTYKANRSLDDSIAWKNVFSIMKTFEGILEDKGIIVEKVAGAEGDDMIFAWSTYLNSLGEDCIMWTGDKDLLQLVNYNKATESFSLWYDNTRHRVGVYPGFDKWLEISDDEDDIGEIDFLDMMDAGDDAMMGQSKKQLLKNLVVNGNLKVEKVFCDEFAFIKILTGDKGDNIESVCLKPSKNGEKRFKISEKKAQEILSMFKKKNKRFSATYLFNESYKKDIVKFIKEVMNVNYSDDHIMANLERNIDLILLHVVTIPDAIQKSMFDVIKEDHKFRLNSFANITSNKLILEDTEYAITNKPRSIAGPPKNIKGLF
jgi:5'-3' exonuclease